MKKQNGFIATSLLYSFFLAFIALFVAMLSIYLQNRIYLNKLEDSSKNAIYIREIKEKIGDAGNIGSIEIGINGVEQSAAYYEDNTICIPHYPTTICVNATSCEKIYYSEPAYILEGCSYE